MKSKTYIFCAAIICTAILIVLTGLSDLVAEALRVKISMFVFGATIIYMMTSLRYDWPIRIIGLSVSTFMITVSGFADMWEVGLCCSALLCMLFGTKIYSEYEPHQLAVEIT